MTIIRGLGFASVTRALYLAACGGLKPAPAGRLRGPSPTSDKAFTAHNFPVLGEPWLASLQCVYRSARHAPNWTPAVVRESRLITHASGSRSPRISASLILRSLDTRTCWRRFVQLVGHLDHAAIDCAVSAIELVLAAGMWRMAAGFFNAAKVPLDSWVPGWSEGKASD